MFLEKDDTALVTAECEKLSLDVINQKIRAYERKNNMIPKPAPKPFIKRPKIVTGEDLRRFLNDNGVA